MSAADATMVLDALMLLSAMLVAMAVLSLSAYDHTKRDNAEKRRWKLHQLRAYADRLRARKGQGVEL